ncbi:RHS repeat-associated core domain-containing protein, partial [Vibrio navarrensis]
MIPKIQLSRRQFIGSTSSLAMASTLPSIPLAAQAIGQPSAASSRLATNPLGFNGLRLDPVTKSYPLGNGYRQYNPRLKRFHAADSLSPFGQGGVNSYAYCLGDPVNLSDPSGHFGIIAAIIGAIASLSLAATAKAVAVGVAVGVGIAAAAEGLRAGITGT